MVRRGAVGRSGHRETFERIVKSARFRVARQDTAGLAGKRKPEAPASELHAIRIALVFGVVFVAIAALMTSIRVVRRIRGYAERQFGDHFSAEAEMLFDTGKLDRLITHCQNRLVTHPNHAYALWYLGRALYLEGRHDVALDAFRTLRHLHPIWARDHIDPFIAEMKGKEESGLGR